MDKSISDYLADYAAATGCTSDYQIANKLNVTKQAVSYYRRGKGFPGVDVCWQIAHALNVPLDAVIASVEIERANCANDVQRAAVWRSRLSSLSAHGDRIFSLLAVLSLSIWTVPECILCQIANRLSSRVAGHRNRLVLAHKLYTIKPVFQTLFA